MKKKFILYIASLLLAGFGVLYSQTPVIIQFDTIGIKGMPLQPVLKIYINAPTSDLTLSKLVIKSYCEDFLDVDSVAIYWTKYNRFSRADYEGDWISNVQLITKRKSVSPTDSLVSFRNMTFPLQSGDNYIWILLDLSKQSVAGHSLKVSIPKDSIVINSVKNPASEQFSNVAPIRQLYFSENFEHFNTSTYEPLGWSPECLEGCDYVGPYWQSQTGGYGSPDNVGVRNPNTAKSGNYNARLIHPYYTPYTIMLKSSPINLVLATKPLLTFYHAQQKWTLTGGTDSLGVYYRLGSSGSWIFLNNYELATPPGKWIKRAITLPDEVVNENFYLGFKGTAQFGFGVCIDSVMIFETGVEQRNINSIITSHPKTSIIPQSATKNPILRVNVRVKGNTDAITLNSLTVTSGNTNNSDIPASGVRLFYTSDSVFDSPKMLGTAQTFSTNTVSFSSLNRKIETGDNYFWITYDVNSNAIPYDIMDASIKSGDMTFTGVTGIWPATDQSPAGNRIIKQSIFFDDFEINNSWGLGGDFQRGIPTGKGGKPIGGDSYGKPDPTYAYSNTNVIGTDLSNDGDYANSLTNATADTATSPLIKAQYFKNTQLNFYRWLNIDSQDSAVVEYKYAGENNWRFLWGTKQKEFQESNWTLQEFNTNSIFNRKNLRLRFRLGPTSVSNRYSGWNIDYLFVTGDSIKYDAAVTKYITPQSSCGLTSNEYLKVTIKNTGPKTLPYIPIKASMDGGKTWINETIAGPIKIDSTFDYQFTTATNLSKPAIYSVIVKVAYPQDNYPNNDSVTYKLTSIPTYSLPFKTGFENDTSFWTSGGINSTWFQGKPAGFYIKTAAEGNKSWKTDWSGRYKKNENSYIESPCFSFSGNETPIIDFQNSFQTQYKADGAILEYSLDEGVTWNYITGDTTQYSWPWYNDTIQALSGKKGWTGLTGDAAQAWQKSKHLFPEIGNKNKVKFRFVFKSGNTASPGDGFAFDDFRLYNAPVDVGVTSIDNLVTPSCQFGSNANPDKLKVTVKNFGIRDIQAADSIIIGIKVNNSTIISEKFILSTILAKGTDRQFTMTKSINLQAKGNYTIKAFTMIESDPNFYGPGKGAYNDTSLISIVINPNPVTGLVDTVYTNRPQKAKIQAIDSAYFTYNWLYPKIPTPYTLNGYEPILEVKNTGLGRHRLTVTNNNTGCVTKDSTYVKLLISDIGITKIIKPINNCGYGTSMNPIVEIKNFGTDTLKTNDTIPIRLKLDGDAVLNDTLFLTSKLDPGTMVQATLSEKPLNLSVGAHTLIVFTAYPADTTKKNDTIPISFRNFQIYGYPTVDLGPNITVQKLKYTIRPTATSGVTSYKWSDANTTDSMVVSQSGKYLVTVANANGCEVKDSINVRLKVHDLGIKRITGPLSSCSLPTTTYINVKLMNYGTDTIATSEAIDMRYRVNDTTFYSQTLNLASELRPGDSISYSFSNTVNLSKITNHKLMAGALLAGDIRTTNDSIVQTIQVFGKPHPDLPPFGNVRALEYTLDPGIGFKSYVWQDGSIDSSYVITRTHNNDPARLYKVWVTDQNGCTAMDSTIIIFQVYDLELTKIVLQDDCTMKTNEDIVLKITNKGYNGPVDNVISVWYKINNADSISESFKLTADDGIPQIYTFIQKANLAALGTYTIKAGLIFGIDVMPENNKISQTINVYGNPSINFGIDTLRVELPITLDAGAGPGYTYQWNTNELTQTISASISGSYSVRVTSSHGCDSTNRVFVKGNIVDLAVSSIIIPSKNCKLTSTETVGFRIKNYGNIKLTDQPIAIKYQLDGANEKTKDVIFTGIPGDSLTFNFDGTEDLSTVKTYAFNTSFVYGIDKVAANNSKDFTVNVLGLPKINDFGATNDTVKLSTWPKVLDPGAGFATYKWQDGSSSSTFSAITKGLYKVTVTDINGCTASDSVYILNTGIKKLSDQVEMTIYPNPVRDILNVKLNLKKNEPVVIQVLSANGKVVVSRKLSGFSLYLEQLDVYALPRGIYYIRVSTTEWVVTDKVLIE